MGKKDIVPGHATIDDFFYLINERHRIFVNRFEKKQPKPWTTDEIFMDFKFTNVFRELDRGTIALRQMIGCHDSMSPAEIVFNIIWYRMFNVAEHAIAVGVVGLDEIDRLQQDMEHISARGAKVFTDAHMTVGIAGERKLTTFIRSLRTIIGDAQEIADVCQQGRMEPVFRHLLQYLGIGKLFAHE